MTIFNAFLATIAFMMGLEIIGLWQVFLDTDAFIEPKQRMAHLITGAIEFGLVAWLIARVDREALRRIRQTEALWIGVAFVLGLLTIFLQQLLALVYSQITGLSWSFELTFNPAALLYWGTIATVFLAPIAEELFFRVVIQKRLQMRNTPAISIQVTALLFALLHLPWYSYFLGYPVHFFQPFVTFFLGLISGWLYYRSGTVAPSILFHSVWNVMAVAS